MKKLVAVLFFALLSSSLFAQTDNMKEQATTLTEKMNSEITSENKTLALSDKQKTEISELIAQRIQAFTQTGRAEKDADKRKEAQKEAVKPFNKKIYTEVLSREQKMALDAARAKAQTK